MEDDTDTVWLSALQLLAKPGWGRFTRFGTSRLFQTPAGLRGRRAGAQWACSEPMTRLESICLIDHHPTLDLLDAMHESPPPPPVEPTPPPALPSGSPTDFLKGVVGKRVVVRLTSGVDYKGKQIQ